MNSRGNNTRRMDQNRADEERAYAISDKRTTNLAEALRMAEEDRTTATLDQKLDALHEAIQALAGSLGGLESALHDLDAVMWKQTRE